MSFSVELWEGYDLVYNTFLSHRRGLKDFIYMLSEKHDHEFEYAKAMKKVYDMNYAVTKMHTLQSAVLAFKNDLLNHFNYTIEFVNSLREEVIDPLKTIMNEQNFTGKKLNLEMRKTEKDFRDCVDKLEKARIKFHTLAKNAEDIKLQLELNKTNQTISSDTKAKLEIKSQMCLKDAKEAERQYISIMNMANNMRESYIETMKRILNEFQSLEEKLIDNVKDGLRKYVIYQVALVRNLQYDIEKKASVMEGVNAKADIRYFIEKNATNCLPPYKFEFIPYISELDSKTKNEQCNYPKEVVNNVKNFISNVFYLEPPESEPDSIETRITNEIQIIVDSAWEGKRIPQEQKTIFLKYIKEKKYRRFFISCVNKYRMNGLFTLDEKAFFSIGDLLFSCLDYVTREKDYESAKYILNLAQTLYKTASEPNKPRIFLQAILEMHGIWKSNEFWDEFIKYIINEEMHNQKNYNIYTFESAEEKNRRIKNIVIAQLVAFSYNMVSFEISRDRVKETIINFSKYYDIDEDKIQEIIKSLEEYNFINETKIKSDFKNYINNVQEKPKGDSSSSILSIEKSELNITIENNNNNNNNDLSLSTNCKVSENLNINEEIEENK